MCKEDVNDAIRRYEMQCHFNRIHREMREQKFDFVGAEDHCGKGYPHPPHKMGDGKRRGMPYIKFCCGVMGNTACGFLHIITKVRKIEDTTEGFLRYKGVWWIEDVV